LRPMQNAAPYSVQPPVSGLTLVETDALPATNVVGISASWRKLLMQAEMVAPYLQLAAIEGEHGTGKHTLARYLFKRSPMAENSFQRRDAREWLATASSETPLRQMAGQGLLLPDLAFRLTAIRFAVPPLRQRREDIAPLAQSLLDRICARYQQRPVILGPGALARLLQHGWPGNVRELASVLETALLEASNGIIQAIDLNLPTEQAMAIESPQAVAPGNLSLDAVVRHHVQYVLDLNRGNKLRAARQLQISRSTLYRILANENFL